MPHPPTATQVLDRELLTIRARLIDLAAALDRLDRAQGSAGSAAEDPRLEKIRRSLEILAGGGPDRAEQVQLAFSLPYQAQWQEHYGRNSHT